MTGAGTTAQADPKRGLAAGDPEGRAAGSTQAAWSSEPDPALAAPSGHAAGLHDHAAPLWEGRASRRHARSPVWRYRLRARVEGLRRRRSLAPARVMTFFVGWPRSGHSLIGSLLDAHPQAVVAHELDAVGLFRKGLDPRRLPALMAWNSDGFGQAGRWWNGYRYAVPGGRHGARGPVAVVGDKKGDWAARWSAADPTLPSRLTEAAPVACRWILVTRHPLDNVATMSLRKGGAYDRLRIDHAGRGGFGAALAAAQDRGEVAHAARDDMVADWRALAAAIGTMRRATRPAAWHRIVYERFVADPHDNLRRLCDFLELPDDSEWRAAAASLVSPSGRRSRDSVAWTAAQREALADSVAAHDFLDAYRDDL